MHYIVYTDLDGTLLDEQYSYEVVKKTVEALIKRAIPIVLCSSKTRAEIELYRSHLKIKDPFISENGGAIFIESDYFEFDYGYDRALSSDDRRYRVLELGTNYEELRRNLKEIEEESAGSLKIRGFGDMSAEEIAVDSGLSLEEAELSKLREYDEAFKIIAGEKERMVEKIEERGLHFTLGGRYYHILGDNDKGKAVEILNALFKQRYTVITTIGIGDSFNDLPLLRAVDIPVLVAKPNGSHEYLGEEKLSVRREAGIGPVGWKNVMEELILRS
ncbi:MAG: HAD-IIB family hydrolase [Methanophagales archaeon ANME-1-THS]|nr:MAG: HAD-IIB family hydrolase [Methanophagales archaeon ANME-1-THS]